MLCNHHLYLLNHFSTFYHSKRKPHAQEAVMPPPHLIPTFSQLQQPLFCFLSLRTCLFWVFHINGIIQYVVSCVWLLSLGIMLSSFIHFVAYIGTSFFLWLNNIPLYEYTISIHQLMDRTCLEPISSFSGASEIKDLKIYD